MSYYTGLKRAEKMTRKCHGKSEAEIRRVRIILELLLSEI